MSEAQLWWGMLFGAIGLGYFVYGTKQRSPIPLVTGIALMAYPYFFSNGWLLLLIGVVLTAIPYFIRL